MLIKSVYDENEMKFRIIENGLIDDDDDEGMCTKKNFHFFELIIDNQ